MIHRLWQGRADGYGFHVEGQVGLAHARRSIIDLVIGAADWSSQDLVDTGYHAVRAGGSH